MAQKKKKFDVGNEQDLDKAKELGNKKKFTLHDLVNLKPLTDPQRAFIEAYYSDISLIFQDGCAGTGKTLLALYCAFTDILEESTKYNKVVLVRSPVETRSIGFLKGTQEEKLEPYEQPFKDAVDYIFRYNDPYNNLKSLGLLEFHSSGNLRGKTFDNSIIVIEECQNMDISELRTVLTRVGQYSRIILCGDIKQNDLFRYKHGTCYDYLNKLILNMPFDITEKITYTAEDIVRSGLAKEIIKADDKIDLN